jgi:type IV pilus assembly protein PilM
MRIFEALSRRGGGQIVGLDIGSSAVKLVEIETRGDSMRLLRHGVADLLPDAIVDGEVMDRQLVVETIQNLFDQTGAKTRRVATAMSGRGLIVKKIAMDRMTREDAGEAIVWEAEKHVPYDINDVSVDFEILDTDLGPKQMQVLLVAAKRDAVSAHAELLREAGLEPAVVDVAAFAVQNAIERNYEFAPEEFAALLNIGAESTNLNVVHGGVPSFTQDLPSGTGRMIEDLQRRTGLSREEAAVLLMKPEGEAAEQAAAVVGAYAEEATTALDRALAYLKTAESVEKIHRLLLSGGGARIPGVADAFTRARRGEYAVEVADPLKRVDCAGSGDAVRASAPMLAVGIGLALRKDVRA